IQIAIRSLRKRPGFAIASILILALGIGATTSMFTLVHSLLYKPLPFSKPDQLIFLFSRHGLPGGALDDYGTSPSDFLDWKERSRSLADIASMQPDEAGLTGAAEPQQLNVGRASVNLFTTLGSTPIIGRTFTQAEQAGANVAIISYSTWKERFGS